MKKDIILSGVGGQGILSIATVIGQAATKAGLNLKQAEVHGMSQRGGDVQSDLRLSTEPICSDLIGRGTADLIISMEPMEALRYLPFLAKDGTVVTSSKPFINIPNYPDEAALQAELDALPSVVKADVSSNMMLLGAAAKHIGILSPEQLREAIAVIFESKGAAVVEANQAAFDQGAAM